MYQRMVRGQSVRVDKGGGETKGKRRRRRIKQRAMGCGECDGVYISLGDSEREEFKINKTSQTLSGFTVRF